MNIQHRFEDYVLMFFLFFSLVQENLIRDDNKLILLASLSDSLEYVADSIERQVLLSGWEVGQKWLCLGKHGSHASVNRNLKVLIPTPRMCPCVYLHVASNYFLLLICWLNFASGKSFCLFHYGLDSSFNILIIVITKAIMKHRTDIISNLC